jgi:phosphoserine phosphatase
MKHTPIRLVAFDLDGTLLRHQTVCELLAHHLGTSERMRQLEQLDQPAAIRQARREMLGWYRAYSLTQLCAFLPSAQLAPGAEEGIALLKQHQMQLALVSITWEFAVAWFAHQWGMQHFVGTRVSAAGAISHFWPADKAGWVARLAHRLQLDLSQVAAVGDSAGDVPMLRLSGFPIFVGKTLPEGLSPEAHDPAGDIYRIAQRIVTYARRASPS